ncbi:MAG TPA: hypothetical protein VL754_12670 [Verrucomicrobiae bacterium]|jgi:hypothetical protein|nr:hypothetical protein [Verrucomicrobiae bacterium]
MQDIDLLDVSLRFQIPVEQGIQFAPVTVMLGRRIESTVSRVVVGLIIASLLQGCFFYRFHQNEKSEWLIKYGDILYPAFTADEKGNTPTDKSVAEQRFERRKNFLHDYYHFADASSWALALFAPVILVAFIFGEMTGIGQLPEDERRKRDKERSDKLRDFIAADMEKERMEAAP